MNSITIRSINFSKDLQGIVSLLKKNLNQNFSEDNFRWKHLDNPFGKSHGQIALCDNKIIAVRIFMCWEFLDFDRSIRRGLRPVDSVTDLNYRGRGIFNKLTKTCLESCIDKYEIIFNTPNNNSLPLNLNLGWKMVSNINYCRLGIINILLKKTNFKNIEANQIEINAIEYLPFPHTIKSKEYLQWRYKDFRYKIAEFCKGSYIIYSVKKIKGLKTLIVYEILGNNGNVITMLRSILYKERTIFLYYYKNYSFKNLPIFSLRRKEPKIVYKFDKFGIHNLIDFSLGDLEAKL